MNNDVKETVRTRFLESRDSHQRAMAQLAMMRLPAAVVLAWSATWSATDALILARLGYMPENVGQTCDAVRELVRQDANAYGFHIDFFHRASDLFDSGIASHSTFPPSYFRDIIGETSRFIDIAEHLSGIDDYPD